ncbi:MAG: undecaprenyl-diphosphate phosphatase, partial [Thermoplasmata archaeon]
SIPIIIAALAYSSASIGASEMDAIPTIAAAIVAFVVGLLALKLLFGLIQKFRLRVFSVYCWAVGALVLFLVSI